MRSQQPRLLPLLIAGVAGASAVFVLFVASVVTSGYVEPGNRIEAFLTVWPQRYHPLRLLRALWALHLVAGAALGAVAGWVAWRRRLEPWHVWFAFAAGYLAVLAMSVLEAHAAGGVVLSQVGRAVGLLISGALAMRWSGRARRVVVP